MDKLKLSVIVLSYNQEKFIYQTIDSILSQEHEYSYEIIICDDASTDSTPNIIKTYAKNNKNIKPILREINLGVVNNFYDAISRCKGEYIMVCGGDDYYLVNKIKEQISYLDEHKDIGLLYSDVKQISEDGQILYDKKCRSYVSPEDLISNYSIYASTMAIRSSDLEDYMTSIKPIDKDWVMEDLPLSLWFCLNNKICYFPLICVAYRVLDDSISHPKSMDKRFSFEVSAYKILSFFQSLFPQKINFSFIVKKHLSALLDYQKIIDSNKRYCLGIVELLKKNSSDLSWVIFKIRIKFKLINLFFRIKNKFKRIVV